MPPEVVAANRSLLMSLVATNLLGQNTPAIATTEVQYGEMWAQDVEAMYGYAGSAASATQVTPFSSPQRTTNAEGVASQAAAVGQASGSSAGNAQSMLSHRCFSAIPNALANFATSDVIGPLTPLNLFEYGADFIAYTVDAPISPLGIISLPLDMLGAQTGVHTDQIVEGWAETGLPGAAAASPTATSDSDFRDRVGGVGRRGHDGRAVRATDLDGRDIGGAPDRAGVAGRQRSASTSKRWRAVWRARSAT